LANVVFDLVMSSQTDVETGFHPVQPTTTIEPSALVLDFHPASMNRGCEFVVNHQ